MGELTDQIAIALLRSPGHSLRDQLDEAHHDLTLDFLLVMVVPLVVLSLFLAQSHLRGLPQMAHLAAAGETPATVLHQAVASPPAAQRPAPPVAPHFYLCSKAPQYAAEARLRS